MEDKQEEMLNAMHFIAVTLMRIYDAQMALLENANPEMSEHLYQQHEKGRILTPPPFVDDAPYGPEVTNE